MCKAISNPELANATPVTPPTVNKKMNPSANNMGARSLIGLPHKVANQLKTLIPVGTAILDIVN